MIGDRIRQLRKACKLTQEQLAENLGISSQAVSKWETGASTPDLDVLPRLAVLLHTTPDVLLDFDRQQIDTEVEQLVAQACPLRAEPEKGERFFREALKRYPNNEKLLNCLLTMIPNDRAREKIEIGERLLGTVTDEAIRLDVLRLLAQTCHNVGDQALAERYLRQLPDLCFLKAEIAAMILSGEAQKQAIQRTEEICLATFCAMLALRLRLMENDSEREQLQGLLDELLALFSRIPAFCALADSIAEAVNTSQLLTFYR